MEKIHFQRWKVAGKRNLEGEENNELTSCQVLLECCVELLVINMRVAIQSGNTGEINE